MAKEKRRGNENFPPLTEPLNIRDKILGPHMEGVSEGIKVLGHFGSNEPAARARMEKALDPSNSAVTRGKARTSLGALDAMKAEGTLVDHDLTMDSMVEEKRSHIFHARAKALEKSAITGKPEPMAGSAWYYTHHRGSIDPTSHLTADTQAAASAVLSPSTTPEDERASLKGIRESLHPGTEHTVTLDPKAAKAVAKRAGTPGIIDPGTHAVHELSSSQFANIASQASEDRSKGRKSGIASTAPLADVGRVVVQNVQNAREVVDLNEGDPWSHFDPATRPKTLFYGKNIAASAPGTYRGAPVAPEGLPQSASASHLRRSEAERGTSMRHVPEVAENQSANALDHIGIAQHFVHGDPNQGMFMFSRESPDPDATPASRRRVREFARNSGRPVEEYAPKPTTFTRTTPEGETKSFTQDNGFKVLPPDRGVANEPSILSVERDTPMDQWEMAAFSGAPPSSTRGITNKNGTVVNRRYSPAKRIVDAGMPGGLDNINKESLGLPDDPRVTVEGVAHAVYNEANKAAARSFGPISHDQFGQPIEMPSGLTQEVGWTNVRDEAGGNKAFNAEQRDWGKAVAAQEKAEVKATKQADTRRGANFYREKVAVPPHSHSSPQAGGPDRVFSYPASTLQETPQMFPGGRGSWDRSQLASGGPLRVDATTPIRVNPKAKPEKPKRSE